jgi:hypothetical protein
MWEEALCGLRLLVLVVPWIESDEVGAGKEKPPEEVSLPDGGNTG